MPRDRTLGPCAHGTIGAFYFYAEGSRDDPAFGFCDIEVSVQSVADGKVRLELYCIADGYQSARGVGARYPLKIAVIARDHVLAVADWHFADVICGHAADRPDRTAGNHRRIQGVRLDGQARVLVRTDRLLQVRDKRNRLTCL